MVQKFLSLTQSTAVSLANHVVHWIFVLLSKWDIYRENHMIILLVSFSGNQSAVWNCTLKQDTVILDKYISVIRMKKSKIQQQNTLPSFRIIMGGTIALLWLSWDLFPMVKMMRWFSCYDGISHLALPIIHQAEDRPVPSAWEELKLAGCVCGWVTIFIFFQIGQELRGCLTYSRLFERMWCYKSSWVTIGKFCSGAS